MSVELLQADGLTVRHGQLVALRDVSLQVRPGEVVAVVGANGAGKTTLLRTIAGLHHTTGRVVFDGTDVTHASPHARVRRGIAMVPEGRRLFMSLTVEENLLTGTVSRRTGPWDLDAVFGLFGWMQSPTSRSRRSTSQSSRRCSICSRSCRPSSS